MGHPDTFGQLGDRTPSPRSDPGLQGIAEGAETRLRSNSYLALKNVTCDFRDGVLTLRGCLPTYYLKQMAQTAVARMEGVQRIVNEIVVVASPGRSGILA
jgi:osmotically-inducible protein OsmY